MYVRRVLPSSNGGAVQQVSSISSLTLSALPTPVSDRIFFHFRMLLTLDIGWKYYISYCIWLLFEVIFVYSLFPETSGRSLEELAFREYKLLQSGFVISLEIIL